MVVSFSAKWIMDTLQFHFENSKYSKFKNQQFWNPKLSWENKYKEGSKLKKLLLKTTLVFATDAWHLFQFIHLNSYMAVIALNIGSDWVSRIIVFAVLRTIYSVTGLIFYR